MPSTTDNDGVASPTDDTSSRRQGRLRSSTESPAFGCSTPRRRSPCVLKNQSPRGRRQLPLRASEKKPPGKNMIDDLQTLCVAALRRGLRSAGSDDDDCGRIVSPRLDRRAVEAIFDCVKLKDRPLLQCEATLALVGVYDRLSPKKKKIVKMIAVPNLFDLLRPSDVLVPSDTVEEEKAVAALLEILHSDTDDRRNLLLGPMVRGVMGNHAALQNKFTTRFSLLLSRPNNPPTYRVIDSGVAPRFVEFLRRDDYPELQHAAVRVLTYIGSGAFGQVHVVIDAGAIPPPPPILRLLQSPDDEGMDAAAWALGRIAAASSKAQYFLLQNHAMPPLLSLVGRNSSPRLVRTATWAIFKLCYGPPPPPLALVRPSLPALAQLIFCSDQAVVRDACRALSILTVGPGQMIQEVVASGVCRRLVELLPHPSLEVQLPVLDTLANIVHGNDQQKQAILRHDPLSYISALLISPENPIRGSACRTVAKILFDNQHQVKAFHDNNLVPPLLQCLSDADPTVRNTAGLAMYFVTRSSTPQQTQRLVQEGCIPRLCDLLADYDTSTVCFALKSIGNVLHASGSPFHRDGAGNAGPTAALVLEAGGVAKMNRLLGHADEEIREGVTRVLTAYFCWWDEDKGNGPEDITVADTAAEASGDADGGPEPPLQRPRLS